MSTPAYALAHLRNVRFGDDIIEYLRSIDATLAPYAGRFLVHGGPVTPAEGEWQGDLVIIEFPSPDAAAEWYSSPAYQEIVALRTDNSDSVALLVEGLPPGYLATDGLARMLSEAG